MAKRRRKGKTAKKPAHWKTCEDYSEEAFHAKTVAMETVNAQIVMPKHRPEGARPRCTSIDLSTESLKAITEALFCEKGCLKKSLKTDIAITKQAHIGFVNPSCTEIRNDKRWQIPIKKHPSKRVVNRTRKAIESALAEAGVIDLNVEILDEVGIIVTGKVMQPLHCDMPRLFARWSKEFTGDEKVDDTTLGWEVKRAAYNAAMSDNKSPSSILLGLGEEGGVFLGVQRDEVEKVALRRCKVKGGKEGEEFEIVAENEHLVVIKGNRGFMFTGDLKHAGATDISQVDMANKFNEMLDAIMEDPKRSKNNRAFK
jgi:hypothetical protein